MGGGGGVLKETLTWQRRKLRHKRDNSLARGHTLSEEPSQVQNNSTWLESPCSLPLCGAVLLILCHPFNGRLRELQEEGPTPAASAVLAGIHAVREPRELRTMCNANAQSCWLTTDQPMILTDKYQSGQYSRSLSLIHLVGFVNVYIKALVWNCCILLKSISIIGSAPLRRVFNPQTQPHTPCSIKQPSQSMFLQM